MFSSAPKYGLPSFSELVQSIEHQKSQQSSIKFNQGCLHLPMPPIYSSSAKLLRSFVFKPYARPGYDSMTPSPSLSVSRSPARSVHLLDLCRVTPDGFLKTNSSSSYFNQATPSTTTGMSAPPSVVSVSPSSAFATAAKRKYTCSICGRGFTTLGHLARHNRTHTGERKHVCPHPLCDARFARQDNCMQHYKTHMHGRGRRTKNKVQTGIGKPAAKSAATVLYVV